MFSCSKLRKRYKSKQIPKTKLRFTKKCCLNILFQLDITIFNYFSDENKVQCAFSYKEKQTDKDMFHIPRTYILRKSDFATLDNINYDMVYNEILASQTSDELKEYTFYFIQEMISGYEQREKNRSFLLDCILKALSFLNKTVAEYPYSELINNFEAIQCKKID